MSERDPLTVTDGHCDGCGRPTTWGGIAWYPHTEAYHAARRRLLTRAAYHVLLARVATLAGHRVRLRFTADVAWTECRLEGCEWVGAWVPHSGTAAAVGHRHLVFVGRDLLHRNDDIDEGITLT